MIGGDEHIGRFVEGRLLSAMRAVRQRVVGILDPAVPLGPLMPGTVADAVLGDVLGRVGIARPEQQHERFAGMLASFGSTTLVATATMYCCCSSFGDMRSAARLRRKARGLDRIQDIAVRP